MNKYISDIYNFLKKEIKRFRIRKFISNFSALSVNDRKIVEDFSLKIIWARPVISKFLHRRYGKTINFNLELVITFLIFIDNEKEKKIILSKLNDFEFKKLRKINIVKLKNDISKNPWDRNFHPRWLYEFYCSHYGKSNALKIMKFNNSHSEQYFIIIDMEKESEIISKLEKISGIKVNKIFKTLFSFPVSPMIFDLNNFEHMKTGEIFHTSIPAFLMTEMVENVKSGIDLCAAPGSKSLTFKSKFDDIHLISLDYSFNKCKRMNLKFSKNKFSEEIFVINHNAIEPPFKNFSFDLVVLDSPCSGSGIIRKRPELRWRMRKNDLLKNIKLQEKLINEAGNLVKKNGFLIYSTCSINPEENIDIIEKFLDKNSDFKKIEKCIEYKNNIKFNSTETILPSVHELDGFFYSVLKRRVPTES